MHFLKNDLVMNHGNTYFHLPLYLPVTITVKQEVMNLIGWREIERVGVMRKRNRKGKHPGPINEFVKMLIYEIAGTIHILYLHTLHTLHYVMYYIHTLHY